MDKASLIARKQEVIAQKQRLLRQLQRPNMQTAHRQRLQQQLQALMAEESRLRQKIDRGQ